MNVQAVLERTDIGPGCWQWLGRKDRKGYAQYGHKSQRIHKQLYELLIGPVPEGLVLDHLCDNPGCVNPMHLKPTTHRENILRGNGPAAQHARQTHCSNGHVFDEANTYINAASGSRVCRTCMAAYSRARRYNRG